MFDSHGPHGKKEYWVELRVQKRGGLSLEKRGGGLVCEKGRIQMLRLQRNAE